MFGETLDKILKITQGRLDLKNYCDYTFGVEREADIYFQLKKCSKKAVRKTKHSSESLIHQVTRNQQATKRPQY